MPTVAELTYPYGNFMLGPHPGKAVCEGCFDLTAGPQRCYRCARAHRGLDAVAPISYSVAQEQLHHALAGYKRPPSEVARRFEVELAAVLWRYLDMHEQCVARAAGTDAFELVTTVPSSTRERDAAHPLHRIVGELAGPTRDRHERLLRRSKHSVEARTFSVEKFHATRDLAGRSVLLIDDTWTTGATARSAAAALEAAGAGPVAAVVIGRHLNRDWRHNGHRLDELPRPFDWERCAVHASRLASSA
ncbi:MAG: phosphoribosyltransferase family protein [Solirubrobacteraceae bacterium]